MKGQLREVRIGKGGPPAAAYRKSLEHKIPTGMLKGAALGALRGLTNKACLVAAEETGGLSELTCGLIGAGAGATSAATTKTWTTIVKEAIYDATVYQQALDAATINCTGEANSAPPPPPS